MKINAWIFSFCLIAVGCQQNSSTHQERSVDEIMTTDKFTTADLIRNPVSADEHVDTINVAKMVFSETQFDFGEVAAGAVITHVFHFTNTGKIPLVITHARSTCGCTVPEWPDVPVPPGETGEIKVQFNTSGRVGPQVKPVNITANTYPALTTVNLVGIVNQSAQAASSK